MNNKHIAQGSVAVIHTHISFIYVYNSTKSFQLRLK